MNEIFGLKIKILEFYTQNRARYPIYDETMQSRSLLEGKTIELKQFLKSIILTPKIANKNIAFLFVLSIHVHNHYFSNIFSSETTWPINAKFYVEPPWEGRTKVYTVTHFSSAPLIKCWISQYKNMIFLF